MMLLSLLLLAPFQEAPVQAPDERLPEVLIVGTFHMANPGQDLVNADAGDILAETRQTEVADLVARLARFEATHVAVEQETHLRGQLDGRFRAFLDGELEPARDEIYQLAFPLAAESRLERVDAIDHGASLQMQAVMDHAAAHQPEISKRFDRDLAATRAMLDALMKRPLLEIFRAMNTPIAELDHGFYMLAAQVGSAENQLGAEMTATWYARNLKIFGNIARLATEPDDRILVLIGSGHGALLREFVANSPNLRLADTLPYLD